MLWHIKLLDSSPATQNIRVSLCCPFLQKKTQHKNHSLLGWRPSLLGELKMLPLFSWRSPPPGPHDSHSPVHEPSDHFTELSTDADLHEGLGTFFQVDTTTQPISEALDFWTPKSHICSSSRVSEAIPINQAHRYERNKRTLRTEQDGRRLHSPGAQSLDP